MQPVNIRVRDGETLRRIEGIWYRCFDVGCPNFEEARNNRANQWNPAILRWWENKYEKALEEGDELPEGMSYGGVPTTGKRGRAPSDENKKQLKET